MLFFFFVQQAAVLSVACVVTSIMRERMRARGMQSRNCFATSVQGVPVYFGLN